MCGNRKGYSKQYALVALIEGWRDSLDKGGYAGCLLYTSPSPRDATLSRMPSSA